MPEQPELMQIMISPCPYCFFLVPVDFPCGCKGEKEVDLLRQARLKASMEQEGGG